MADEWLEEYGRVCKENKVTLQLGKGVDGASNIMMAQRWANALCIG